MLRMSPVSVASAFGAIVAANVANAVVALAVGEGPTSVSFEVSLSAIVAVITFAVMVFPAVWFIRGIRADIDLLMRDHRQLEEKIKEHGFANCPVVKDYLERHGE